jgi:hypothetical protein
VQWWVKGVGNDVLIERRQAVRKVTAPVVARIEQIVSATAGFVTVSDITHRLRSDGLTLSESCVRFWMKRRNLRFKKAGCVFHGEGLLERRLTFCHCNMNVIDPERVVSIDESSFYFDMRPTRTEA